MTKVARNCKNNILHINYIVFKSLYKKLKIKSLEYEFG